LLGSALWWPWVFVALATSGPLRAGNDEEAKDPGKQAAKAREKTAKGPDWLTWDQGLLRARDKYLPVILLFDGQSSSPAKAEAATPEGAKAEAGRAREGEGDVKGNGDGVPRGVPGGVPDGAPPKTPPSSSPSSFEESLANESMKDVLKHFVLIRLEASDLARLYTAPQTPGELSSSPGKKGEKTAPKKGAGGKADGGAQPDGPPPTAPLPDAGPALSEKFTLSDGKASLVVLNFREEEVLRYDQELPPRPTVRTKLTRVWQVNEIYAKEARRVEAELSTSRYAYRLNNYREAVLKVKPFEGKEAQVRLDTVLKKRVNEVIQEYKGKANEAIRDADKLDREKKYTQAISAFDAVCKNFPFLDIMQQANKRKSEILRKLTFGG
jgi:hypothetical protein